MSDDRQNKVMNTDPSAPANSGRLHFHLGLITYLFQPRFLFPCCFQLLPARQHRDLL